MRARCTTSGTSARTQGNESCVRHRRHRLRRPTTDPSATRARPHRARTRSTILGGEAALWRTGCDRQCARCSNVRCGDSARRDVRSSHRDAASKSIEGRGIPASRSVLYSRSGHSRAAQAAVDHFVYISVAHPAPVMHAYIAVRQEGEALIRATRIRATILRPWYILGPGLGGRMRCFRSTRSCAGFRRREMAPSDWGSLRVAR